jgi:gliding motility-associated-like protein
MIVFDRWGVEVFSSDDITKGWNGKTVNDEPMPEGVYVYRLEMRSNTNRDIVKNGQITLLR